MSKNSGENRRKIKMSNLYNIENFDENGIAWPYSLKTKHDIREFENSILDIKKILKNTLKSLQFKTAFIIEIFL